jgi:hypothetical protein
MVAHRVGHIPIVGPKRHRHASAALNVFDHLGGIKNPVFRLRPHYGFLMGIGEDGEKKPVVRGNLDTREHQDAGVSAGLFVGGDVRRHHVLLGEHNAVQAAGFGSAQEVFGGFKGPVLGLEVDL